MTGLRVVDRHAVNEHERLAEGGAADGQVGLDAARASRPHVNAADEAQRVGHRHDRQLPQLVSRQEDDGAADAEERFGRRGGRHHDRLFDGGLLRHRGCGGEREGERERD
jgi:hypothetical protein